jgi:hypothetical protein
VSGGLRQESTAVRVTIVSPGFIVSELAHQGGDAATLAAVRAATEQIRTVSMRAGASRAHRRREVRWPALTGGDDAAHGRGNRKDSIMAPTAASDTAPRWTWATVKTAKPALRAAHPDGVTP